ncbi:DUF2812 domain-containing protein [Gorillibacterium sp. sgz500922]|uniref:DUF2812 domain-containing protein n=1 Tax=Gorillibacterium sp. sgz500922 TaxID=3446694 RepID=UPI003F66B34D
MNKNVVYKKRISFAWDFRKEEEWINRCSEEGYQMDKIGLTRRRFRRDAEHRYVYRYDLQDFKVTDRSKFKQYLALYADAGWDYVDSFLWWHCFRKPYEEGVGEELYTDWASRRDFFSRIIRISLMVGWLNLGIFALNLILLLSIGSDLSAWANAFRGTVMALNGGLGLMLLVIARKLKTAVW